ncbi:hypothetical protein GCM10025886_14070 [Tetragenococcus halophilus subsp. flandriensis]|uniref:LPD11 domain-containing protein n=1 Tax=Tetragenococcus halophilus TaxID=51669 RepID=UPI0023E932D5|nr:LPD11 domain-containing protein [Tetragenococcus halophilus]GMA08256.1 hypothetical protein GCM10025886_14070 [Tetragenococcus halophilus subsp. flandriensis]
MNSSVLSKDKKFRYQLLDRMKQEVSYCIRYVQAGQEDGKNVDWSRFLENHLSEGTEEHFSSMKELLNSFNEKDQPEWYSLVELHSDKNELEALVGRELG